MWVITDDVGSFNEAGADAPEILFSFFVARLGLVASMRPGRMPRKYRRPLGVLGCPRPASMRPGRMPRKYISAAPSFNTIAEASMRPGRMPRKYKAVSLKNLRR